ncbi:Mss4-like protein [Apiospora sp. TS-2023a]
MKGTAYNISCHCGNAAQTVFSTPQSPGETEPRPLDLCHCKSCRHNTGVACVSYMGLAAAPSLDGLRAYEATPQFTRYFCATCGCHICWRHENAGDRGPRKVMYAVATGVIVGRVDEVEEKKRADDGDAGDQSSGAFAPEEQYGRHINVAGTKDGGLSRWMPRIDGRAMETHPDWGDDPSGFSLAAGPATASANAGVLDGFCHCGTVQLLITRPDASSRLPRSGYSDLIVPFHTGSPRITNPDDEKWWLRPSQDSSAPIRYLAGTCACRSCRLISGFEIQTWAFIPRSNIHLCFGAPVDATDPDIAEEDYQPLDFAALAASSGQGSKKVLQSYESSPGVMREFCAKCGATVFWHDKWRPDLIDVSVGLLDAPEGVRAESWLDWWTGRVSFAEDAGNGRHGEVAKRAVGLIQSLEDGLKKIH